MYHPSTHSRVLGRFGSDHADFGLRRVDTVHCSVPDSKSGLDLDLVIRSRSLIRDRDAASCAADGGAAYWSKPRHTESTAQPSPAAKRPPPQRPPRPAHRACDSREIWIARCCRLPA